MNIQRRFFSQFLSGILTFLIPAVFTFLIADDTEIYFSGSGTTGNKPKVLFVLDTSVSMAHKVPVDDDNDGNLDDNNDGDITDPGDLSRIEILGNAMENLLTSLDNVRVGVMRMNGARHPASGGTSLACGHPDQRTAGGETYERGRYDAGNTGNIGRTSAGSRDACYLPTGATVLFPVADLDARASTITGEGTLTQSTILVPVSASEDDVEQERYVFGGPRPVETDNRLMQMSTRRCQGGVNQPSGPNNAYESLVRLIGHNDDDVDQEMPSGPLGTVNTRGIGPRVTGFRFEAVNIPRGAWIENAYLRFGAANNGTDSVNVTVFGDVSNNHQPQRFAAGNGPANRLLATVPELATARVDWTGITATTQNTRFPSPDLSPIVQEIVNHGDWNSGQPMSFLIDADGSGGSRNIHDRSITPAFRAQLIVSYCQPRNFANSTTNRVGLRFQDVRIPQGATILDADILFTAANPAVNVYTDPALGDLLIQIEDTDDAGALTAVAAGSPGANPPPVTWPSQGPLNPIPWVAGDTYNTPPLASLVQHVVDRPGWCGGNNMAFAVGADENNFFALGFLRAVSSYDDDPARAPILRVTYDRSGVSGGNTGCNQVDYNIPVGSRFHDAEQRQNNSIRIGNGSLSVGNSSEYGLIFSLPVARNITVNEAQLQFTINQASGNAPASFFVNAENIGDAPDFSTNASDISSRALILTGNGNSVAAAPPGFVDVDDTITLDVTSLVQEVVRHANWAEDSKIALFVRANNGERRRVYSYDGDAVKAPRLLLKVEEQVGSISDTTVRRRLLELNDSIGIPSLLAWTPSVETLYESALYWRGKPVDFGRQRGQARLGSLMVQRHDLVNEAIDYTDSMHQTLTSHPGSWSGGTYDDGDGIAAVRTECQFSHTPDCAQDRITGSPVYTSPAGVDECAANYTIFLTDGAPTLTSQGIESKIISEFSEISACVDNDQTVNAQDNNGRCAVEMAQAMANNDQDGDSTNGDQTVKTYTIAFDLADSDATSWLTQIATAGGGRFFSAANAAQLASVFDQIFGDVLGLSTTFSSPAITTNFFNRTRSRDEIYFGLFSPELERRWDGNVKRFRVCVDDDTVDPISGQRCTAAQVEDTAILDQTGMDAVDPATLLFVANSQSYWSATPDGSSTAAGGAGAEVSDFRTRIFYTDEDTSGFPGSLPASLDATGFTFTFDSTDNSRDWDSNDLAHVHGVVCNDPTALSVGQECYEKMLWLLGRDIQDEDNDADTTETRWGMGDIVHASPVVITYGFSDTNGNGQPDPGESLIDKLLVNANDGGLRMINPASGMEDWVFMPGSTLANVGALYDNEQGQHLYGLDSTPVLHQVDVNNNGVVDPADGDFVRIYQAMRRGGQFVYALDLTPTAPLSASSDPVVPKILWRIQGGTGDYARLGDTWSRPTLATIRVRDGFGALSTRDVLIMGGGYDNDLDNNFGTANANPNQGNAIYIIDPDNGELLLSISHAAATGIASSGADLQIPGFHHAITANINVLNADVDINGTDDRLYFPDTAGNIWRIDLGDDILADGSGLYTAPLPASQSKTTVGLVADLSGSAPADERRFYQDLTAVQVVDKIHTDTTTDTDNNEGKLTYLLLTSGYRAHPLDDVVEDRFYALRDKVIYHMTDTNNDRLADGTGFSTPITEADLEPVTTMALDDSNRDATSLARARSARGYYLDFPDKGEKGLSTITVLRGQVFFTTYVPADLSTGNTRCSADIGESFGYSLNLATGNAVVDWDGLNGLDLSDRRRYLGAGLTSDPLPIFTDAGVKVITGLQQSVQALSGFFRSNSRTYWYEDN